jgi:hypothetical protein
MSIDRKKLIYLLSIVIAVIVGLVYYYLDTKYFKRSVEIPKREVDYALEAKLKAQQSIDSMKTMYPMKEIDKSKIRVFETQAIKLVKDSRFQEVSEKPVDPFTQLAEMAKSKKKVYVNLSEKDLDKKINLYDKIDKSEKIKTVNVPPMGENYGSSITPVYAPCKWQVFKSSSSWASFIEHHMVREKPEVDFSKNYLLTIVSDSELPPGIFKIDSYELFGDVLRIKYRVDIFELAEENKNAKRNFYSIIKIPKNYKSIELIQIQ